MPFPQPPNSASSPQDISRAPQDAPSATELARETMVPNVLQASQRGSLEPAQETGPSPSAAGAHLALKPRSAAALCLAAEESELLLRSCDINVQNTILHSRPGISMLVGGSFSLIGVHQEGWFQSTLYPKGICG